MVDLRYSVHCLTVVGKCTRLSAHQSARSSCLVDGTHRKNYRAGIVPHLVMKSTLAAIGRGSCSVGTLQSPHKRKGLENHGCARPRHCAQTSAAFSDDSTVTTSHSATTLKMSNCTQESTNNEKSLIPIYRTLQDHIAGNSNSHYLFREQTDAFCNSVRFHVDGYQAKSNEEITNEARRLLQSRPQAAAAAASIFRPLPAAAAVPSQIDHRQNSNASSSVSSLQGGSESSPLRPVRQVHRASSTDANSSVQNFEPLPLRPQEGDIVSDRSPAEVNLPTDGSLPSSLGAVQQP